MRSPSILNWQVFQFASCTETSQNLDFLAICPDVPSWFVFDSETLGILCKYDRISLSKGDHSSSWFPEGHLRIPSEFPGDTQARDIKEPIVKCILERYAYLISEAESKSNQIITKPRLLYSATVNVTARCNLRCPYCSRSRQESSRTEPHARQIKQLFAKLAEHGVKQIFVTGGEPFLRNDICDLLKSCLAEGMAFEINTNGFQIDENIAFRLRTMQEEFLDRASWPERCHRCGTECAEFVSFCLNCGIPLAPFAVRVSIDGSQKEINDSIRGKGSFNAAVSAIDILVENNLCVIPSVTVTNHNIEDIPDLVNLLRDKNLRRIRLQPVCPVGNAALKWGEVFPETPRMLECLKQLSNLTANSKGGPFIDDLMLKRTYIMNSLKHEACRGCNHFYVDSTGDVYPCDQLIYPPFLLGTAEDDISELLDEREKIRDRVCVTYSNIDQCRKCIFKRICNAGCPGQRYSLYRDLQKPDPYCESYARFYLSEMENTLLNAKSPRNLASRTLAKNQQ